MIFGKTMKREFDAQENCIEAAIQQHPIQVPVVFLFSGKFRPEERGAFEKMVRKLREEWTSRFDHVEQFEIASSGHYLQSEAPDTVVDAIHRMILNYLD